MSCGKEAGSTLRRKIITNISENYYGVSDERLVRTRHANEFIDGGEWWAAYCSARVASNMPSHFIQWSCEPEERG